MARPATDAFVLAVDFRIVHLYPRSNPLANQLVQQSLREYLLPHCPYHALAHWPERLLCAEHHLGEPAAGRKQYLQRLHHQGEPRLLKVPANEGQQ